MTIRRFSCWATGLVIVALALVWAAGEALTRGGQSRVPPAAAPARDLVIRVPDGTVLAATYRPGSRADAPAILLLHGVGASRGTLAGNASWLADRGYATLTIDFRGHGGSTTRPRTFGWTEAADAHAAFTWLKRRQHGARIGVVGISMGGAASLLGPAGPLPADALVLQAVYPDLRSAIRHRIAARLGRAAAWIGEPLLSVQTWPRLGVPPTAISPASALPRFTGALLVIGGRDDQSTPAIETRRLHAAEIGSAELWLVPRGDHAAICAMDDPAYRKRLLAFFQRTLQSRAR